MVRYMYDSVNAQAIPADAKMVAGYVDGRYKWSQNDWDRFPDAVKVRVSAIGATHIADAFDVEPECIWPPEYVVPLVQRARAAGLDPTVYCNQMNHWRDVRALFDRLGIRQPHYWVANYDGVDVIPDGAVAKQYAHPPQTGKHYDLSVVRDYWPGVDEETEEMGYGLKTTEFPGSPTGLYAEKPVVFPHRGGDTKVTDVYVTLFCPGMPYVSDTERAKLNLRYTHFVGSGGEILGHYYDDDSVMEHLTAGPGVRVPDEAVMLVVQYDSPVEFYAETEVKTSA